MASMIDSRAGGAAAVAAGVLGVLLLPLVTAAYGVSDAGEGTDPSWGAGVRDSAEPLFGFADPDRVYSTYGLLYVLVLIGLLLGLLAVREHRAGGRSGLERWGFRLMLAGLGLSVLGLLTDYTFFEGTVVENVGFAAGSLLGLLALTVGATLLGARWLRDPDAPRAAAILLVLSVLGMVVLGLLGFQNLPSMPLAWFGLTGIPLGLFLLKGAATRGQRVPAAPA